MHGKNLFQERLNQLFAASDRRLTNREVSKGIRGEGCPISVPYLSQLRSGRRSSPSDEIVNALTNYFSVPPGYFFMPSVSDADAQIQASDAKLIERLDDPVLQEILEIANGLSATSVGLLIALADRLRVCDQRRTVPADSPTYVRMVQSKRIM